jgi:hypothetical protein
MSGPQVHVFPWPDDDCRPDRSLSTFQMTAMNRAPLAPLIRFHAVSVDRARLLTMEGAR